MYCRMNPGFQFRIFNEPTSNGYSREIDKLTLDGTTVKGPIYVLGNLTAENHVTIEGEVDVQGGVKAIDTKILNTLNARGSTLELIRSEVSGDVNALPVTNVTIKDSRIGETLTCTSNHLVIEGSQIKKIVLKCRDSFRTVQEHYPYMKKALVTLNNGKVVKRFLSYSQKSFRGKDEKVRQILELKNCTVKEIVFEGNKGEVILTGNSQVTGTCTGEIIKE